MKKARFLSALRHLILPTIALGTIPMAVIARMTRSSMLEVLGEEYIRVARAKGLAPMRVIMVHALRNALIPVITVIGLQVGVLFAGAILTETIFSWPGIGKWIVEALNRRELPDHSGRYPDDCLRGYGGQSARRSDVWGDQSPHPAQAFKGGTGNDKPEYSIDHPPKRQQPKWWPSKTRRSIRPARSWKRGIISARTVALMSG